MAQCKRCLRYDSDPDRSLCSKCLDTKTRQKTNQRNRFKEAGLCIDCGSNYISELNKLYCEDCRKRRNATLKRVATKLKLAVITVYGGKCKCCGETNIKFLTIDHVNGGGNQHRKEVGYAMELYRWLKKNNYPPGFQILCWNCNCGRAFNNGIYPHAEDAKL